MVQLGHKWGPAEAQRKWVEEYGEVKAPTVSCISKVVQKFDKIGCIHNQVSTWLFHWK